MHKVTLCGARIASRSLDSTHWATFLVRARTCLEASGDAGWDGILSKRETSAGRRLRHTEMPREKRVNLRISAAEYEALKQAAARSGLAVGAYAARSAVSVAKGEILPLPVDERELRREVVGSRASVDMIGSNLNQIARVFNSGGTVPPAQLEAVLIRVDAAVRRLDDATIDLMSGHRS